MDIKKPLITTLAVMAIGITMISLFFFDTQKDVAGPNNRVHVAVAANFTHPIVNLAHRFQEKTKYKVDLSFSSTGKLYAQIKNGAPFGVFFAADIARPKLLEEEGLAIVGSRFTYAVGKIVLWSRKPGFVDSQGKVLAQGEFHHLAMANPALAPYGKAAQEILTDRVYNRLQPKIVLGENINQTFQFVHSKNAALGFVAYSQVRRPDKPLEGSYWEVPQSLYTPIEQQAVLLKGDEVARKFLDFVQSNEAQDIICSYGYGIP